MGTWAGPTKKDGAKSEASPHDTHLLHPCSKEPESCARATSWPDLTLGPTAIEFSSNFLCTSKPDTHLPELLFTELSLNSHILLQLLSLVVYDIVFQLFLKVGLKIGLLTKKSITSSHGNAAILVFQSQLLHIRKAFLNPGKWNNTTLQKCWGGARFPARLFVGASEWLSSAQRRNSSAQSLDAKQKEGPLCQVPNSFSTTEA